MRILRKDYRPVPDTKLDGLKRDVLPVLGTMGHMTIPARTLYQLVMEVIDSREEIFRLQLCETVDKIIADELDDDEEDLLAFRWPNNDYCFPDDLDDIMGDVLKPAFPCKQTVPLPRIFMGQHTASPEQDGRRLPRIE